jgi:hypothetical protein
MRSSFLKSALAAVCLTGLLTTAQAQTRIIDVEAKPVPLGGLGIAAPALVYNNLNNYQGFYFTPGGAVAGATPFTRTVFDDVTFIPGQAGKTITQFYFSLFNATGAPVAARPVILFWLPNNTDGNPGAYFNLGDIANQNFGYRFTFRPPNPPTDPNGFPIPAGLSLWFTDLAATNPTTGQPAPRPVVPPDGKMWVGQSFDNNANAAGYATPEQLNQLGVALYDPPTGGSSENKMFLSTNTGLLFGLADPPGSQLIFNTTDPEAPIASMAFGFSVEGFTLFGQVAIEGITNPLDQVVQLEFFIGGVLQFSDFVQLTTGGAFEYNAPAGNYTVRIKGEKTLSKTVAANLSTGDAFGANVSLLTGDANNDNAVDISDLLVVIGAYNQLAQTPPDNPNYNFAADFNEDNVVDIADLLLLIGNYNKLGSGPTP